MDSWKHVHAHACVFIREYSSPIQITVTPKAPLMFMQGGAIKTSITRKLIVSRKSPADRGT